MWNQDHFFEKIDNLDRDGFMLRDGEGVPENGVFIRPHMHLQYEIMWFRQASGAYTLGNEKFPLRDNTLVLVAPLTLHDMELNYSDGHERFLLQYDATLLNHLKVPDARRFTSHSGVIPLSDVDASRVQMLFSWLSEQVHRGVPQESIAPLLSLLFSTIYQHAAQAAFAVLPSGAESTFDKIIRFVGHLETLSTNVFSLSEAAHYCDLSVFHFSRSFKAIMHVNFKDYLLRRKIARAVHLLTQTDMAVTEIAYRCEFTDSAYFCLKFRLIVGVTPKTYRQNSRTTKQLSSRHDKPTR